MRDEAWWNQSFCFTNIYSVEKNNKKDKVKQNVKLHCFNPHLRSNVIASPWLGHESVFVLILRLRLRSGASGYLFPVIRPQHTAFLQQCMQCKVSKLM